MIITQFDDENSASKFINNMKNDIESINICIEQALVNAQTITHKN